MVYFVYRWWTDSREINYKQNESCPLEGALHSTVRTDVSKDTSTTNEHSTQRITVTTESRWREILARQQNSSQLDPEQGRMEAVRKTRSRRDSHADKQGGMGVLLDCRESSRSWFERSASLATEKRRTLVAWATMVDRTDRRLASHTWRPFNSREFVRREEVHIGDVGRDEGRNWRQSTGKSEWLQQTAKA